MYIWNVSPESQKSWPVALDCIVAYCIFNSPSPDQNVRHLANDILKCIFKNEMFFYLFRYFD